MAKLSGYRKLIKWMRIGDDFKETSTQTRADSVLMADNTTLEDKLSNYNPVYSETAGVAEVAKVANKVAWNNVTNKPSTYPSTTHTHDERYYTESEITELLKNYSTAKFTFDESTGTLTITN